MVARDERAWMIERVGTRYEERRRGTGPLALVPLALALVALPACRAKPRPIAERAPVTRGSAVPPAAQAAPPLPDHDPEPPRTALRYLAIGGGATPESTEVSIEQDIELLEHALKGPGATLFAGGPDSRSVREADTDAHPDPLLVGLGDLFSPRAGRTSRYRRPKVGMGRATSGNVEKWLSMAVSVGSDPLLVYIASHGDQGASPRDNVIALWGGGTMTAARFADLTEDAKRPVRLVATSCFSGGFAEIAFARGDEHAGPTRAPRCGLFAGPWDRQTSGCDANPDRRAQESYGIHFIHALSREDRAGRPLAPAEVDFDQDGVVSLLEAHTRARIASASLDVPTTTSERWLRSVEHGKAAYGPRLLPEEQALIEKLGRVLGLTDETAVMKRASELEARLDALDRELDEAQKHLDEETAELSSRLLERWPVLDDAYHPEFSSVIQRDRASILMELTRSSAASRRGEALRRVESLEDQQDGMDVEEARVQRLVRAYETLHAAAALEHRGGEEWTRYQALLACERGEP